MAGTVGVTGASGFIGSYMVKTLEVLGFDYITLKRGHETPENFASKCDVLVNCAGVNRGNESEMLDGNMSFLRRLYQGNRKIINIGTIRAGETTTAYGRTKSLGESYALYTIRFPNVYGPGSKPNYNSVVATFINSAIEGEPLKIKNNKMLGLVFVKDLVDITISTINWMLRTDEEDLSKTVALFEPSTVVSLWDLAYLIIELSGSESEIMLVGEPGVDFSDAEYWLDIVDWEWSVDELLYHPQPRFLLEGLKEQINERKSGIWVV